MVLPEPTQPLPADDEMSADRELFRQAFRRHAASVVVVTYIDATGAPRGMTATAMSALSVDPPSLIVCIDRATRTHEEVMRHRTFAIDMLAANQRRISVHCARRGADKRLHDAWLATDVPPGDPPRIAGAVGHMVVHDRFGTRRVHPHGRRRARPARSGSTRPTRSRCCTTTAATRGWLPDPVVDARPVTSRAVRCPTRSTGNSCRSARQHRPQARRLGASDDRVGEHDIRQTDAEVRDDHASARRPRRAGQDRLAEGRAPGRDSRRTGRRRGWPGTGRGRRRGTGPRRGRPTRRTSWRSRPGTTSASGAEPRAVHHLAARGIGERRRGDRRHRPRASRSRVASAATAADPIPDVDRATSARASARSSWRSTIVSCTPGSVCPRTSRWLCPCTPAPTIVARAVAGARVRASGPNRAIATPDTAAVRCGRDRPAVEDRPRLAGRRVAEHDDRMDRRQVRERGCPGSPRPT